MADPRGFLKYPREAATRRPVDLRIHDWREVYEELPAATLHRQAARCMDCGIPFCSNGCPLGNLIPDWNDLAWRDSWRAAIDRLHATNNFPEFTGRLCPAPCEAACVLGINEDAVTIKRIEVEIIDRAWDEGWVVPMPPAVMSGRRVAVVGSGPAGLAAAQQLTRAGHGVVVFERADRPGGLLRYGIPDFKMEKRFVDRRLEQMAAEGTEFRSGVDVGRDVTGADLRAEFDAIVLAIGAGQWRELPIEGRRLSGIHQAMEYLPQANRVVAGDLAAPSITAAGKHVIIIGGGDTGADCLGTAHRQGAASVRQFEIMPEPPPDRDSSTPWPTWPWQLRTSSAHEEGGDQFFSISTVRFTDDGAGSVAGLETNRVTRVADNDGIRFEPVPGTEEQFPADLVLLALGFTGPEPGPLIDQLGLAIDDRGTVARDAGWASSTPGVFVAGDMGRGQSLIVWAIAEGRAAAAAVDAYLTGASDLPAPVHPSDAPLR